MLKLFTFSSYIILCVCLLFACTSNNIDEALSERVAANPSNSDNLFSLDQQLRFMPDSIGSESDYCQPITYNGRQCLSMINYIINGIDIYDIEDPDNVTLATRFSFEREGPQGVGDIHGFDWVNEDSIFLVSSPKYGNVLSLGNADGQRLRVIKRKALKDGFTLGGSSASRVYFYDGKLYMMRNNSIYLDREKREMVRDMSKVEEVIDVETGEALEFDTPFSKNAIEIYYIYYRNKGANNTLLYSCRYDHYLYAKDMDGIGEDGYDAKHLAKSKFIGHFYPDNPEGGSASPFWEQQMGCYFGIFYDPYREVYYRFAYPALDYKTDPVTGDKIDRTYEAPFSIIVLDKNFKKLGEQLFPPRTYRTYFTKHLFIGPKGLYLSMSNPFNKEVKEDEIAYQLLELKPEVLAKKGKGSEDEN